MNSRRPLAAAAALALAALACQTLVPPPDTPTPPPVRATLTAPAPRATAALPPSATPSVFDTLGLRRANPFPADAPAGLPGWTVEVLAIQRGDEAWRSLRAANQFNDPAPEGLEYLLVQLRVTSTAAGTDAHAIQASDFKITGDRLVRKLPAAAVTPEPRLEAELRGGESTEGWSVYLIGAGEGQLMLIYDPLDLAGEFPPRYLALEAGASLSPDPALGEIAPTLLGADPRAPVPLGAPAITTDWEVTALEAFRGDAAWALVLAANQFNDPPAPGLEYVAVKVRVRLIRPDDAPVWISESSFACLTGAGERLTTPTVVDPEPALDVTLYPGGEHTGWVVLQAPAGDTEARLIFQPWLAPDEQDTRYFRLTP